MTNKQKELIKKHNTIDNKGFLFTMEAIQDLGNPSNSQITKWIEQVANAIMNKNK